MKPLPSGVVRSRMGKIVVVILALFAIPFASQQLADAFHSSLRRSLLYGFMWAILGAAYGFLVGAAKYRATRKDLAVAAAYGAFMILPAGITFSPSFWGALDDRLFQQCPPILTNPLCAIGIGFIGLFFAAFTFVSVIVAIWYLVTYHEDAIRSIRNIGGQLDQTATIPIEHVDRTVADYGPDKLSAELLAVEVTCEPRVAPDHQAPDLYQRHRLKKALRRYSGFTATRAGARMTYCLQGQTGRPGGPPSSNRKREAHSIFLSWKGGQGTGYSTTWRPGRPNGQRGPILRPPKIFKNFSPNNRRAYPSVLEPFV